MHFRTLVGCFLTHCFSFVADTVARDIRLRKSFLNFILRRPSIASWMTHAILRSLATTCPSLLPPPVVISFLLVLDAGRIHDLVFAMVIVASSGTPEIRGHDRGRPWLSTDASGESAIEIDVVGSKGQVKPATHPLSPSQFYLPKRDFEDTIVKSWFPVTYYYKWVTN